MLMLAAAAIAASTPAGNSLAAPTPTVQARATVRILSGARLRLDGTHNRDTPPIRQARIRTAEGPLQAQLIEFQ